MDPRLIVALDTSDRDRALSLVEALHPLVATFKVGLQLFIAHGPEMVREIASAGSGVFLDLKLHDIPNTAAGAVHSICGLPGVRLVTLHAGGGRRMLAAAADAVAGAGAGSERPRLLGVTVLTSMESADLGEVGIATTPDEQVARLARVAMAAGLDGLVCSPLEVAGLRRALGPEPLLVTPGVRPAGSATDDQRRVATPAEALAAGASHLVVGRPITGAADPREAAGRLLDEMP